MDGLILWLESDSAQKIILEMTPNFYNPHL